MALTDVEFEKLMCIDPSGVQKPSEFYCTYVKQVQMKISQNAKMEFNCLSRLHTSTGEPRSVLSDQVSKRIVKLTEQIQQSDLGGADGDVNSLCRSVLTTALPAALLELVGMDGILQRLPATYVKSIFASSLAAQYVYTTGLDDSPFSFYSFV